MVEPIAPRKRSELKGAVRHHFGVKAAVRGEVDILKKDAVQQLADIVHAAGGVHGKGAIRRARLVSRNGVGRRAFGLRGPAAAQRACKQRHQRSDAPAQKGNDHVFHNKAPLFLLIKVYHTRAKNVK